MQEIPVWFLSQKDPLEKGLGHSLQYSWASLVAQLVKNPPAMRETWDWSLGWEDPLEEGTAIHSGILAWRIPIDRGACRLHRVAKSRTRLRDKAQHSTKETWAEKVEVSRTKRWSVSYKANNQIHIQLIQNVCICSHTFWLPQLSLLRHLSRKGHIASDFSFIN